LAYRSFRIGFLVFSSEVVGGKTRKGSAQELACSNRRRVVSRARLETHLIKGTATPHTADCCGVAAQRTIGSLEREPSYIMVYSNCVGLRVWTMSRLSASASAYHAGNTKSANAGQHSSPAVDIHVTEEMKERKRMETRKGGAFVGHGPAVPRR